MLRNGAEVIKDRCQIKPVGKRYLVIQPEDFVTSWSYATQNPQPPPHLLCDLE